MKNNFTPTLPSNRIQLLDVLRGFAIFGILMVNMQIMNAPLVSMISGLKLWSGMANDLSGGFIRLFFESKFYVIFSLLFGYGFWLFMNKRLPEGRSINGVYLRRVFFLLLFGIAHVVLLWPGDILVIYAIFGFLLLLFRKTPNRKLIRWALAFMLIPIVVSGILAFFVWLAGFHPEAKIAMEAGFAEGSKQITALADKALRVYPEGSFREIVQMRLEEYRMVMHGFIFFYPNVLAMFLLGLYGARKGYLQDTVKHYLFFRKTLLWGLIIGLPLNLLNTLVFMPGQVSTQPSFFTFMTTIASGFGGLALSLAYVAGIVLLLNAGYLKTFAKWLAPVGRMALTNYLTHSILANILFMSFGFALYGKVNIWSGILITLAIFILQIAFSKFWLKYFHFGPFEWLWRSLTYLQWQPMRKHVE
ncbi:MAG TPA: DUF418 domain-containing protein [Bacteroidales bacterium]|nr:DUF418 domain-containing protein [Bacteroidales bacterium]